LASKNGKSDAPVNSRSGHSKTWWAKQLIRVVEPVAEASRLEPGRRLARRGGAIELTVEAGALCAVVIDGKKHEWETTIEVAELTADQWSTVLRVLTDRTILLGRLLNDEMPELIGSLDEQLGFGIYPDYSDIRFTCSCDEIAPCRHALALWYGLADRLDFDPLLLFQLRGRRREQLMKDIYSIWEVPYDPAAGASFGEQSDLAISDDFFTLAESSTDPAQAEYSETVDVLDRLGFPPFFPSADRGVVQTLRRLWEGEGGR
jgi:uncharacterized Zn finger protein